MKPGRLTRQMNHNAIYIAAWPKPMREAAGFTDADLTPEQRREAASQLRKRADELNPPSMAEAIRRHDARMREAK